MHNEGRALLQLPHQKYVRAWTHDHALFAPKKLFDLVHRQYHWILIGKSFLGVFIAISDDRAGGRHRPFQIGELGISVE